MKVIGNEEKINSITLSHKSAKVNLIKHAKPLPDENPNDFYAIKGARIVFDDLIEVDNMIQMLEYFRDICTGHLGEWDQEGVDQACVKFPKK